MLRRLSPFLLLSIALAACGGGGASGSAPIPHSPATGGTTPASVAVSISIPAAATTGAANARRPLYVSTNTHSAAISVNGGAPVVTNLSAGSPGCTTTSGGARTCSINVSAPTGSDRFAVSLYASADGSGAVLSQNSVTQTITGGTQNTVALTLDGIVASASLSLADATPTVGVASTTTLTVNFFDASGAAIIGNDAFVNAITLTNSDTSGATSIPAGTLKSPADGAAVTVSYNGAALAQATFGATATGLSNANVKTATLTPQSATVSPTAFVDWPTYGFDSQRSGYNPSTTGITPASISQMHLAWQKSIGGATQTQPIVVTNVAGHSALLIVAQYVNAEAYDALTGNLVWRTALPRQDVQECGTYGISGTAQYDKALNSIFMAAGDGNGKPNHTVLYRLDAGTGAINGHVDVTPTLVPGEADDSHTSLTLANGRIYLGTGSDCEGTSNGAYPSWRGRVVSVDPSSMTLDSTFFSTWGQGGNYGGGGVWSWGGVSADSSGNIFVATGNAETNASVSQAPTAPFQQTDKENAGYAEHLVKLSSDLSSVLGSDSPAFNFAIGNLDLDYAGTPVVYTPTFGSGCGTLTATQGKGGTLVINNSQNLGEVNTFKLSVPSAEAYYIGNPAYSPKSGYLYAAISSSGNGSAMLQPGLAAIGGCGSTISWHAQFGPDSTAYAQPSPRSAPTVTAGGVVFLGTPCTSNGNGGCGTPGNLNGALWAVDGSTGDVLGGGKPLIVTGDNIRMAPSADGLWVWVLDGSGNFYGLTADQAYKAIAPQAARRLPSTLRVRGRD